MHGSIVKLALFLSLSNIASAVPNMVYFYTDRNADTVDAQDGMHKGDLMWPELSPLTRAATAAAGKYWIYHIRTSGIDERFVEKDGKWEATGKIPYESIAGWDFFYKSRGRVLTIFHQNDGRRARDTFTRRIE